MSESRSVVSNSLWPHELYSPWDSPGQNTGMGSLSLLQGIFPAQESNWGFLHCRQILYQLSYQGRPREGGHQTWWWRCAITLLGWFQVHFKQTFWSPGCSFFFLWHFENYASNTGRVCITYKPVFQFVGWCVLFRCHCVILLSKGYLFLQNFQTEIPSRIQCFSSWKEPRGVWEEKEMCIFILMKLMWMLASILSQNTGLTVVTEGL